LPHIGGGGPVVSSAVVDVDSPDVVSSDVVDVDDDVDPDVVSSDVVVDVDSLELVDTSVVKSVVDVVVSVVCVVLVVVCGGGSVVSGGSDVGPGDVVGSGSFVDATLLGSSVETGGGAPESDTSTHASSLGLNATHPSLSCRHRSQYGVFGSRAAQAESPPL
jgi:hypothetical protein